MALTKSDFERYRVNEVLARSKDANWPFSFLGTFQDELKRCEQAGDETGIGLFSLLSHISWMHLGPHEIDPKAPLNPMPQLGEAHLEILDAIVGEISVTTMRGHIADVLWLCRYGGKDRHKIAALACDSYLKSIDQGPLTLWMGNRLERALQIATQLRNPELLDKGLGIAKEIAATRRFPGEAGAWERMMVLLARYSQNDRIKYVEQICQKADEVENEGLFEAAVHFRKDAVKLFAENKQHDRANEVRLELVETLVAFAEHEASRGSGSGWIPYTRAQTQIEQAISHHKKASGTNERLEKLHELLGYYGKKVYENMDWKEMTVELPQDEQDALNAMAGRIAENFRGKPFDEVLVALAAGLQPLNFDAVRQEADRSAGGLSSLFDSRKVNHAGKTVGRGETITVGRCAGNHRLVYAFSMIRPAIIQIEDDHDVQLEDIAKVLELSDFVPPYSRWTYARGLLAGFKFDLATVAHILPPMLENAFREMLASMDKNTARWDSEFISKERSLAWALEQPELEQILGADLLFDLKTLLLDEEGGFNLRNKVSHGLMGDVGFFRDAEGRNNRELAQVIYLWWLALRLCFIIKAD